MVFFHGFSPFSSAGLSPPPPGRHLGPPPAPPPPRGPWAPPRPLLASPKRKSRPPRGRAAVRAPCLRRTEMGKSQKWMGNFAGKPEENFYKPNLMGKAYGFMQMVRETWHPGQAWSQDGLGVLPNLFQLGVVELPSLLRQILPELPLVPLLGALAGFPAWCSWISPPGWTGKCKTCKTPK